MAIKTNINSHPDVVECFKENLSYNKHIEKPKIRRLKKIDFVFELPFYKKLNIIKINHAFMR